MDRVPSHAAGAAIIVAVSVWAACGQDAPGFGEGEDFPWGPNTPSSCCCMANIIMMASKEGIPCPDGYAEATSELCPGGTNYPNPVRCA